MSCTPQEVITPAQCMRCLDGMQDEVLVYLLCQWAGGAPQPIISGQVIGMEPDLVIVGLENGNMLGAE